MTELFGVQHRKMAVLTFFGDYKDVRGPMRVAKGSQWLGIDLVLDIVLAGCSGGHHTLYTCKLMPITLFYFITRGGINLFEFEA